MKQSPIIIIGMHRSGTSLVCKLLEQVGLFIGKNKDPNLEPFFFIHLNEFILRTAGCTWDNPAPLVHIWRQPEVIQGIKHRLQTTLKSVAAISYYGPGKFILQVYFGGGLNTPWGWKDPRNTLTLPLWLEIFPQAKVIHITRHGLDVARSLQVRALQELSKSKQQIGLRKNVVLHPPYIRPIIGSTRSLNIEEGLRLWDEYLTLAYHNTSHLNERLFTMRYEELLGQPEKLLPELVKFCRLNIDTGLIKQISQSIQKARSNAYKENPQLAALAERESQLLARHGY